MITTSSLIKNWHKIIAVVILGFLSINTLANEDDWTAEKLMFQLSQVKHAKLNFVETKQSIFLITDLVIEGTMEYKAPDYIEKNTLSPTVEKIVISGDSMDIERSSESGKVDKVVQTQHYSVQSHPVLKAGVESIRSLLAGNYDMLNQNYDMVLEGVRENWSLELAPKGPEILEYIEKITLNGEDTKIKKVVTIQADGDESVMELTYEFLN